MTETVHYPDGSRIMRDTQIPETTVATQSLPKVGFRKAIQLEVLVIRIEGSKIQQHHLCRYRVRQVINSRKRVAANRKVHNNEYRSAVDRAPHYRLPA